MANISNEQFLKGWAGGQRRKRSKSYPGKAVTVLTYNLCGIYMREYHPELFNAFKELIHKQLDYRPNPALARLKTNSKRSLALLADVKKVVRKMARTKARTKKK